jgi:hypothetical protein
MKKIIIGVLILSSCSNEDRSPRFSIELQNGTIEVINEGLMKKSFEMGNVSQTLKQGRWVQYDSNLLVNKMTWYKDNKPIFLKYWQGPKLSSEKFFYNNLESQGFSDPLIEMNSVSGFRSDSTKILYIKIKDFPIDYINFKMENSIGTYVHVDHSNNQFVIGVSKTMEENDFKVTLKYIDDKDNVLHTVGLNSLGSFSKSSSPASFTF